jgi:hypothetical protein
VAGKTNANGMRWCGDRVEWLGLLLPALLDPQDLVVAHGLSCPVKHVRLARRKLGPGNRFYARLMCAGYPAAKRSTRSCQGTVGLDPGPRLVVVAEQEALLHPFCPEVSPAWGTCAAG